MSQTRPAGRVAGEVRPEVSSVSEGEARFQLESAFWNNVLAVFATKKALYQNLKTNAVTWKDMTIGAGATHATVDRLVKTFFEFINQQNLGGYPTTQGVYRYITQDMYAIYNVDIRSRSEQKHIKKIPA